VFCGSPSWDVQLHAKLYYLAESLARQKQASMASSCWRRWEATDHTSQAPPGPHPPLETSVLFFSCPGSEGWPLPGCTFSIYLYPLSFWLTQSLVVRPTCDIEGCLWCTSYQRPGCRPANLPRQILLNTPSPRCRFPLSPTVYPFISPISLSTPFYPPFLIEQGSDRMKGPSLFNLLRTRGSHS